MSLLTFTVYTVTLKNGPQTKVHAKSIKRHEPVNGVPCVVFERWPGIAKYVHPVPEDDVLMIEEDVQHCTGREIARLNGDPNWITMVGGDTEQKVSIIEARINERIAKALERLEAIEAKIEAHAKTIDDAAAYAVASRTDAMAAAEAVAELLRETVESKAANKAADAGMGGR